MEQVYMMGFHTLNPQNKMNNQINGIKFGTVKSEGYLIDGINAYIKFLENFITNEALNAIGM